MQANARMTALHDELEKLVGLIRKEKVSTPAGLRAPALILMFEAMPASADQDKLQFDEEGAQEAASSLLLAVAEMTGFWPLVATPSAGWRLWDLASASKMRRASNERSAPPIVGKSRSSPLSLHP
jgi:hypothetical protein